MMTQEPSSASTPESFAELLSARSCAEIAETLSLVGDKWTVLVIVVLSGGPRRFNALKRLVDGISQRSLTSTLRALERDGLVERTVHPTLPPSVEYRLTELGRTLKEPIAGIGQWVLAHQKTLEKARRAFDARQAGT